MPGLLPTAQYDSPSAQPPAPQKPAKERKPRKTARSRLDADPARVPERHVTQKPAQTRCGCCGGALVQIGEERNERIEFKPQVFERVITHRPKMACNQCKGGGVVVAPKDDPPITGAGPWASASTSTSRCSTTPTTCPFTASPRGARATAS